MNTQKQLTQAVFDGLPAEYSFARVFPDGTAFAYIDVMHGSVAKIGDGYDTTNCQNSLIERAADPITALCDKRVDADLTHHVELVDDQIEAEKLKLREQVARLEITVRTQAENIATYQKSLLECNDQCERKQLMIRGLRVQLGEEMKQNIEYRQRVMDAKHDHAITIDATRQAHAVLMRQIEIERELANAPSNAYDDHNAHREFIDGLGRGAKYTVVLLAAMAVIAFLMTMGWVGGAV